MPWSLFAFLCACLSLQGWACTLFVVLLVALSGKEREQWAAAAGTTDWGQAQPVLLHQGWLVLWSSARRHVVKCQVKALMPSRGPGCCGERY